MKKNRLRFISFVLIIAFGILTFRLFDLTLVNGQKFRDQADNSRKKQINEKAARGNIYDRNGELLAGNKAIYNLNVYMDRFNSVPAREKNDVLTDLVQILEEDGVSYLEDFFLGVYVYEYEKDVDYFLKEQTPVGKIVETIKKNGLASEILDSKVKIGKSEDNYYYPINRIIDYLDLRGKRLPIKVTTEGQVKIEFDKNDKYNQLLESKVITEKTTAKELLINTIKDDMSLFYNLLDHPLTRKLVYEIIEKNGIKTGVKLVDIEYLSDMQSIENKAKLNKLADDITIKSSAKDDFISLVKNNTLDDLLTMVTFDEQKNLIVPAELLINKLNAIGVDSEVTFEVDKEKETVMLSYVDGKHRDETPIDYLIRLATENNILDKFIVNKDIVDLAEQSLFNNNIYPRIYRSNWTYVFEKEKFDLIEKTSNFNLGKVDENTSAEELLDIYIKKYDIQNFSMYESFGIISIYNKINSKGYKAYEPVTLASNISERTLVEVEEKMPKDLGFEVVVQPNRYYPNENSFSHTLGYLGKISDEYEMKEYIEHRKYSMDDVIGKTGLEESFEDTLRGVNGRTVVYTDVMGNTTEVIDQFDPVPGNNLYTTVDINYQKEAEKILRDMVSAKAEGKPYKSFNGDRKVTQVEDIETAAAVVTDVKTGEVLASVSYPDFDPNMFVNGISNNDWEQLTKQEESNIYSGKPLMNLVTQAAMPPGSTFKTVISLAALEKGLDPTKPITCYGFIDVGNSRFRCLIYTNTGGTHGPTDMYKALEVSCNYYYYALGLGYNPKQPGQLDLKVALEDVGKTVDKLGLNKNTGLEVNIPAESVGYSPSLYGKQNLVRSMLRTFLEKNLSSYTKKDLNKSQETILEDINTILSWVEKGPEMTRTQVIDAVDKLGYRPTKPLGNERSGLADKIKYTYLNQAAWTDSDSLNMVIGQGQNAYTPIQLNQLASTIANDGVKVKPTFVKNIKNFDNTKEIFVNDVKKSNVNISKESFKHVKEGMRRAAASSYAHSNLPFEIGVKTGTAQSDAINPLTQEKYKDFVWEIGFAPLDKPEIAVTVVLVQGKSSSDAAKVANDLIYAYYKHVKKDPEFTNEREAYAEDPNELNDELMVDENGAQNIDGELNTETNGENTETNETETDTNYTEVEIDEIDQDPNNLEEVDGTGTNNTDQELVE